MAARRDLAAGIHALLVATAGRPANFGCFGMHEWAMVYRLTEDETRHPPTRSGSARPAPTRWSRPTGSRCSHFDAYRFFTAPARPLNILNPAAHDRPPSSSPRACTPAWTSTSRLQARPRWSRRELVTDCFELARDIRIFDMRAAPYDFSGLHIDHTGEEWTPIKVETPEGKREYVEAQKQFAEHGQRFAPG